MSESIRERLAREAVQAEARADAEDRGELPPTRGHRGRRSAVDPSQVYTVRIPVSRLRELRVMADKLGEPPSSLIRRWVLERLDTAQSNETDNLRRFDGLRLGPRRRQAQVERRRSEPAAEESASRPERRRHA
jgi:hypothetical protein